MAIRPLKLSLTTFLKICTKKPRGKIGEIKRFTKGGGYDFYKRMKQIAAQLAKNEISIEEAKKAAGKITKATEHLHTIAAIERLHPLLKAWNLAWREPPEGMYVSPSELLKIKLRPDLAFERPDGKTWCLSIWNLARPELTSELGAEGLWLITDEIGKPNLDFGLLDLRKKIVIGEDSITAASGPQLRLDLLRIEEIWKDIHNPSISIDETIDHIASISLPLA
jgi:hypothetical protein